MSKQRIVNVNLKVPKGMHRKLKVEAAKRGIHLKDLYMEIIQNPDNWKELNHDE